MTVIAAATNGRTVWMATDSASIGDDGRIWHVDKIHELSVGRTGTALIGTAGDHRLTQTLRHVSAPIDPDPRDATDCDGWAQSIAESITQIAVEALPPITEDDGIAGYALLGYAGRLWIVTTDVADRIPDGFAAIGSGGGYAQGALDVLSDHQQTAATVTRAAATAVRYDSRCRGPIAARAVAFPEGR